MILNIYVADNILYMYKFEIKYVCLFFMNAMGCSIYLVQCPGYLSMLFISM